MLFKIQVLVFLSTIGKISTSFGCKVETCFVERYADIGQCFMPSEITEDRLQRESDFKLSCCYFSRISPIFYNWFIDGQQIDSDVTLTNDILIQNDWFGSHLSFPGKMSAGELFQRPYLNVTCKARTFLGVKSHSTRLVTNFICASKYPAESKIVVHPESTQVFEGDAVQFNCMTFALHDFHIEWHINGSGKVPENSRKYEILTQKDARKCENVTSTLWIKNVQQEDFGTTFTCVLYVNEYVLKIESNVAKILMVESNAIIPTSYRLEITALSLWMVGLIISTFIFRERIIVYVASKMATPHSYIQI